MAKNWESIGGGTAHDFSIEAEFIGTFIRKEENVGANHSNMYYFTNEDEEEISIWGCSVLDNRLSSAVQGDEYKIIFKGMVMGKSGREFKNFEVYHAKSEEKN